MIDMNLSKKLGIKLRSLRIARGYTQQYVADVLKISAQSYARIEKGQVDIFLKKVEKLARIFDLPTSKLLKLAEGVKYVPDKIIEDKMGMLKAEAGAQDEGAEGETKKVEKKTKQKRQKNKIVVEEKQ